MIANSLFVVNEPTTVSRRRFNYIFLFLCPQFFFFFLLAQRVARGSWPIVRRFLTGNFQAEPTLAAAAALIVSYS